MIKKATNKIARKGSAMIKALRQNKAFVINEDWFDNYKMIFDSQVMAIRKIIPRGKGIDIGAGSGAFASALGIEYGTEIIEQLADEAEKRGVKIIETIPERIAGEKCGFDFATMINEVYSGEPDRAFFEVKRLLKPGGSLIIAFYDKNSDLGRSCYQDEQENLFCRHTEFYTVNEIDTALERAGFGEKRFYQTLFHEHIKELEHAEEPIEGHGEGGFVVVEAKKQLN